MRRTKVQSNIRAVKLQLKNPKKVGWSKGTDFIHSMSLGGSKFNISRSYLCNQMGGATPIRPGANRRSAKQNESFTISILGKYL